MWKPPEVESSSESGGYSSTSRNQYGGPVPDVLGLLGGQVDQLFASTGYAGIVVSTEATLELAEVGEYDPRAENLGPGLFWNLSTLAFDSPEAPKIRVIPVGNKNFAGRSGDTKAETLQTFYMKPLPGFSALDLVGVEIKVYGSDYAITENRVVGLGPTEVLWEISCR
jgi:hypothetical protein